MATLDSFFILFEGDTTGLDKSLKKSDKASKTLNSSLEKTDKVADNVGNNLKDLLATGLGALTAIASFAGISAGIFETAKYSDELAKNSALLGENINTLAAYQDLGIKAGGSAESMTAVFKNLNAQLNEFKVKGTSEVLPYFQRLGISLLDVNGNVRKASSLLPELADKFSQLTKEESAGLGQKLGLDEGTITLLQQGRKALEENIKKQKELFSITKEQAKVAEDFNDTMHDTSTAFRGLFLTLGGAILPALQWLLESFQKVIGFLRRNEDFTKAIFIGLGAAITAFVLPALLKMGAASIVAFAPFYLIGGAIAGLIVLFGLLYDDVASFLSGGASVFQSLLEYMGLTSKEIESVKEAFRSFGEFAKEVVMAIIDVFKLLGEGIILVFKGAFHVIEPILFVLARLIKNIVAGVASTIEAVKSVGDFVGGGIDAVSNFFGGDEEKKINTAPVQQANANPVNTLNTNNNLVNRNSNIKIDKVEIQTQATDAEAIGKEINNTLSQELANANNNFDDGVIA